MTKKPIRFSQLRSTPIFLHSFLTTLLKTTDFRSQELNQVLETCFLAGCEIPEKVLAFVVNLALGPWFVDLARCHHQNELNIYIPGAIPASLSQNLGWVGLEEDRRKPRDQNLIRVQVILTSTQVVRTLGVNVFQGKRRGEGEGYVHNWAETGGGEERP